MKALAAPLIALAIVLIGWTTADNASADRVYHSSHIALHPVANAPLRAGFVENIHPNGPNVFARERYVLVGASPNVSFSITLRVHSASPVCAGDALAIPSVAIETNNVGNGSAQLLIPPEAIGPDLHGATVGVVWEFSRGGEVVYETNCETVSLD